MDAVWSEFNIDHAVWSVPAHRMKRKSADHCVGLSKQAIAVVERRKGLDDKWVFPSGGGGLVLVLGSWDR
jgi:integrase